MIVINNEKMSFCVPFLLILQVNAHLNVLLWAVRGHSQHLIFVRYISGRTLEKGLTHVGKQAVAAPLLRPQITRTMYAYIRVCIVAFISYIF